MSSSTPSNGRAGIEDSEGIDPVCIFECQLGERHRIPSPDIRVLKAGDGGFVVACDCSDEPLAKSHESPHESTDHFSNIYVEDPSPADWLRLEALADAWYDVEPWKPPEGYSGSRRTRRQRVREKMEAAADKQGQNTFNEQNVEEKHQRARDVACPKCDASIGTKCCRPSGHEVRTCHAARIERAREEGVLESDSSPDSAPEESSHASKTQTDLSAWS
jgi:hypothetical protein